MSIWSAIFGGPHTAPQLEQTTGYETFSAGDWDRAALKMVFRFEPSPAYLGGHEQECNLFFDAIERDRIKYADIEPRRLRLRIMHWLDYFEANGRKILADVQSRKSKIELDAYRAEREIEQERARALIDKLRADRFLK